MSVTAAGTIDGRSDAGSRAMWANPHGRIDIDIDIDIGVDVGITICI